MSYFSDLSIAVQEREDQSYPSTATQLLLILEDVVQKYMLLGGTRGEIEYALSIPSGSEVSADNELLYSFDSIESPSQLLRCMKTAWEITQEQIDVLEDGSPKGVYSIKIVFENQPINLTWRAA